MIGALSDQRASWARTGQEGSRNVKKSRVLAYQETETTRAT